MKLSSALWSNTALTRLNLTNCKLNDDAGAELGYMIVRNVSLTHLCCAWNLFGIKTAVAFQEGLANTRSACKWCVLLLGACVERRRACRDPDPKERLVAWLSPGWTCPTTRWVSLGPLQ
jgi:hypothetical protein